jgi:hypothetical protein
MRWLSGAFALVAIGLLLVLANNNYSWNHQSRASFDTQLDGAIARATDWMVANPRAIENNQALMYMVSDMAKMSGNARLRAFMNGYDAYLSTIAPPEPVNAVWRRFANSDAHVPQLPSYYLRNQGFEIRWDAYAAAPDKVELSDADRANMFSPTKYYWGARHHQLLALAMYRHFSGSSPDLNRTIDYLSEKIARDAHYDFRVSDSYIQRTAFILAAGRPDLIRRRWVERILDYQTADGSWTYCWYGWCRGVFEFRAPPYPAHTTVQAAWALYMLKYRYPEWVKENYR